jgi:hypothetical protein
MTFQQQVTIREFKHSCQGESFVVAAIYAEVLEARVEWPKSNGCAWEPIRAVSYYWVAICGERYKVTRSGGKWVVYVAPNTFTPADRVDLQRVDIRRPCSHCGKVTP